MKEKWEILLMGKIEYILFIFHRVRWPPFQVGHTNSHYVFITQIKL